MDNYQKNRKPNSQNRKRPTKRRPHPTYQQATRRTSSTSKSVARRHYPNSKNVVQRKLNKKKVVATIAIFLLLILLIIKVTKKDETVQTASKDSNTQISVVNEVPQKDIQPNNTEEPDEPVVKREITEWNLRLANYENILPEDFEVEVVDIDDTRQFDARAIKYLKQMMNDMGKHGITNIWVQSAYRSVERQKELYDNSVNKYLKQGKTQEEAERLTDEYINKPGASDHNLGLAVDFNNVDNNFEDLDGFKWLKENAENYGFILRYPKHKEDITKISYESWHWRYVGEEHAKKMNELDMCLEEYIEYLENGNYQEIINVNE